MQRFFDTNILKTFTSVGRLVKTDMDLAMYDVRMDLAGTIFGTEGGSTAYGTSIFFSMDGVCFLIFGVFCFFFSLVRVHAMDVWYMAYCMYYCTSELHAALQHSRMRPQSNKKESKQEDKIIKARTSCAPSFFLIR